MVDKRERNLVEKYFDYVINETFNRLESIFDFDRFQYRNLNELAVDLYGKSDEEVRYFWKWLDETGSDRIEKTRRNGLRDTDELVEMLDYRLMLLRMDSERVFYDVDDYDGFFMTFADTVKLFYDESLKQPGVVE